MKQECRKQQIDEEEYNKHMREFGKVLCPFGNNICSCTYFIKNKIITLERVFKQLNIINVAKFKKLLNNPSTEPSLDKSRIEKKLKLARILLKYEFEKDYTKLAENLYESYKNARLKILEQVKGKIKNADYLFWNQLTNNEKSVWVNAAIPFSAIYLILTKNSSSDVLLTNNSQKVYNNINEKKSQGGI